MLHDLNWTLQDKNSFIALIMFHSFEHVHPPQALSRFSSTNTHAHKYNREM